MTFWYKYEKRWVDVFQIYPNAIHFNPPQFCPFLSLLSFPVFCLSFSIVLAVILLFQLILWALDQCWNCLTLRDLAPLTWTALTDKLISLSIFIIGTFLPFLTFRKSLTSSSFFEKSKWARWDTCGICRWWCSKLVMPRFTSAAINLVGTSRALGNGRAFFRRQQQKNKSPSEKERERCYW